MVLLNSLVSLVGEKLANALLKAFTSRKNGQAKLEAVVDVMGQGLSAIEALRKVFGKDFLPVLNEVLAGNGNSAFDYEAGTQAYIALDAGRPLSVSILRDELNVNLDRVAALSGDSMVIRNQFRGLLGVWRSRCLGVTNDANKPEVEQALETIEKLLSDGRLDYRQVFDMLTRTALGSTGALMVIAAAFIATSTGVGLLAALTATLFGIPWLTVGSLAIPGLLMVFLAKRGVSPKNELSLAVASAYQLLTLMEQRPAR